MSRRHHWSDPRALPRGILGTSPGQERHCRRCGTTLRIYWDTGPRGGQERVYIDRGGYEVAEVGVPACEPPKVAAAEGGGDG